jgi:hypothetical protein
VSDQVNIDELAEQIHSTAREKGFWDACSEDTQTIFVLKQIAMCHSELSETLEAYRKEKGDREVVEELADAVIRILDLYSGLVRLGYTQESFQEVLLAKMGVNAERSRMHGVLA